MGQFVELGYGGGRDWTAVLGWAGRWPQAEKSGVFPANVARENWEKHWRLAPGLNKL